jgi:hypothetical protein
MMKNDQDLVSEYVDKKDSSRTIEALHRELLERQKESILMPNVSTVKITSDGYLDKLGVSHPLDLITDNWGKLMASLWCNTNGIGVLQTLLNEVGIAYDVQHHNWNTSSGTPTTGRSGAWGPGGGGVQANTGLMGLGSNGALVQRSDFNVGTPCLGALGNLVVIPSAGYGSNLVTFSAVSQPATVADTVRESAMFKDCNRANNGALETFCFLRYNYSDTPVGIGEIVTADVTISI